MTSFYIPPKFLKALALFASKDACRFTLQSVAVEVTETSVILTATDGRRLATVNATSDVTDIQCNGLTVFLIPLELIASLPVAHVNGRIGITFDGKEVVAIGKRRVAVDAIQGNYPNWRRVIPESLPQAQITAMTLNFALLADFPKALLMLYGDGCVILRQSDEQGAITIQSNYRNSDFFGALMPTRGDARTIPSWLKAKAEVVPTPETAQAA